MALFADKYFMSRSRLGPTAHTISPHVQLKVILIFDSREQVSNSFETNAQCFAPHSSPQPYYTALHSMAGLFEGIKIYKWSLTQGLFSLNFRRDTCI